MTLRRWISPVLIATMVTALAPATSWAAGPGSSKDKAQGPTLEAAITRAATDAASNPSLQLHSAPPAAAGTGRQVRKQSTGGGGGHTAMIVSLVSAAVGIGATVYMVKEMEKTTQIPSELAARR